MSNFKNLSVDRWRIECRLNLLLISNLSHFVKSVKMSKMPKKTGCTASTSRNSSRTYPIFKISSSKNTTFNNVVFISQNYLSSISSSYAYLPISFFSFGLFRLFRLLHFEFRKIFLTRLYARTPSIFEKKFYAIRPRHSKDFSKSFLNGRIFLYIDN